MERINFDYNGHAKKVSDNTFFNDNIGVSVHILCYNHEKSIKRCIESVLMQKVDFNVEIIIHDDCSTDSSLNICLEYGHKYPNFIHVISENENLYSKTKGVLQIENKLNKESKGLYVALCEGDDYWLDDMKLFRQYHLMISNPNIGLCVHRVQVNNNINKEKTYYPNKKIKEGIIKSKKFIDIINKNYSFQTSSYFLRSDIYFKFYEETPSFAFSMPTNDESWMLYFGSKSDVLYINKTMSCYNKFSTNSWSSNSSLYTSAQKKCQRLSVVKAINEFNEYTNYAYNKSCKKRIAHNMLMNYINDDDFKSIFKNKIVAKEFWRINKKAFIKKWIKTYVFKG